MERRNKMIATVPARYSRTYEDWRETSRPRNSSTRSFGVSANFNPVTRGSQTINKEEQEFIRGFVGPHHGHQCEHYCSTDYLRQSPHHADCCPFGPNRLGTKNIHVSIQQGTEEIPVQQQHSNVLHFPVRKPSKTLRFEERKPSPPMIYDNIQNGNDGYGRFQNDTMSYFVENEVENIEQEAVGCQCTPGRPFEELKHPTRKTKCKIDIPLIAFDTPLVPIENPRYDGLYIHDSFPCNVKQTTATTFDVTELFNEFVNCYMNSTNTLMKDLQDFGFEKQKEQFEKSQTSIKTGFDSTCCQSCNLLVEKVVDMLVKQTSLFTNKPVNRKAKSCDCKRIHESCFKEFDKKYGAMMEDLMKYLSQNPVYKQEMELPPPEKEEPKIPTKIPSSIISKPKEPSEERMSTDDEPSWWEKEDDKSKPEISNFDMEPKKKKKWWCF